MGDAFGAFGLQMPGPDVYSVFAGIEIALWDILGKRLNAPVYQLLGGACHDTVPVYANIYSPHPQTPDGFAEMAMRQVADGYTAIKLYPFKHDSTVAEGIAVMSAVRGAVGPDIGLAVDFWRHASPARAIMLATALEPYDLVLTGETLATRKDFAGLFAARAVDIVNPDICLSGLLELQSLTQKLMFEQNALLSALSRDEYRQPKPMLRNFQRLPPDLLPNDGNVPATRMFARHPVFVVEERTPRLCQGA